jgi:hypothetical protein
MKTKIMLIFLVSNVLSLNADKQTATTYTIKTLKVASHAIELLTGIAIAGTAIAALPKAHCFDCGLGEQIKEKDPTAIGIYAATTLVSPTLIANGIRGLHHELSPKKAPLNLVEKIKKLLFYNNSPAN